MSRTEDILDKTKRKEPEAKKWKVIVVVIVGFVLASSLFGALFLFADVDEYLQKNKEIINLYDFYDAKHGESEGAVYIIGSSIVAESIYPPLINEIIDQKGYSNITVYSAFLSGDTPTTRSVQIQNIIDSKPSLIVYGLKPGDIGANVWHDESFSLVSTRLDIRDDSLYLYTPKQMTSFSSDINPLEHKKYIKSAIVVKYLEKNPKATLNYSYDPLGEEYRKYISVVLRDDNVTIANVNNPKSRYRVDSEIGEEWTQNKEALVYITTTLTNENVPVVILNMPINPLLSEMISDESYVNYYNLLDKTGVDYYNLDGIFPPEYFFDEVHMTYDGALEFAPTIADIIIQELS